MANLFINQAKQYLKGRPSYPPQLLNFIGYMTPSHDLAWDVGTGNGQAAKLLANIYENVVATDTSPNQLKYAFKAPNISYHCTSPSMSISELEQTVGPESSVDVVTVATALHWFDLPEFYEQVNWILKKPNGIIAAWGYAMPEISSDVDSLLHMFFNNGICPSWELARLLVEEKYETIYFPFEPCDGLDHTGPFRFSSEKWMDLETLFTFMRSTTNYQGAKESGVELLTENVIEVFKNAWGANGESQRIVTFPLYLRIGRVGGDTDGTSSDSSS